jgi:flagellar biosynthetic protein FlhB
MDSSSQDKNLPATPRRLQKAREEGQVPRSRDLSHLVVLGGGMLLLSLLVPWGFDRLGNAMRASFTFDLNVIRHPEAVTDHLVQGLGQALVFFLPLGLTLAVAAVLSTVAMGSFAFSVKPMMPQLSKIGLLSGFERLFSRQQFFEVLKLIAITVLLGGVAALFVSSHMYEFGTLLLRPLPASMSQMGQWFTLGVSGLLAVVGLVALVDVPLQQYLYRHRLRMSLQEVKDEHKESEGNPQLKGRMRQRQREIAQRSSIARVPKADLVVMNPTHYAVALKYDDSSMAAPHVIAKGADLLALRIRDVANDAKVPVLQSPMLARALYAHTEIDQQIPAALFTAVAQVLAYVYQLRAAMRGEGPMPTQPPKPEVPVELDPHHGRETGRTQPVGV